MPKKDQEPRCIFGLGTCPPECELHGKSVEIARKWGDKFDPILFRLALMYGDTSPEDVIQVLNLCAKLRDKDGVGGLLPAGNGIDQTQSDG